MNQLANREQREEMSRQEGRKDLPCFYGLAYPRFFPSLGHISTFVLRVILAKAVRTFSDYKRPHWGTHLEAVSGALPGPTGSLQKLQVVTDAPSLLSETESEW